MSWFLSQDIGTWLGYAQRVKKVNDILISPDPRTVIKVKMACEDDKGEGWEIEREKKYTELFCLWEICPWFIETIRQLKERMLHTQGTVSTQNQERQSETIFLMSKRRGQQSDEPLLYPVLSANCTYMFL